MRHPPHDARRGGASHDNPLAIPTEPPPKRLDRDGSQHIGQQAERVAIHAAELAHCLDELCAMAQRIALHPDSIGLAWRLAGSLEDVTTKAWRLTDETRQLVTEATQRQLEERDR